VQYQKSNSASENKEIKTFFGQRSESTKAASGIENVIIEGLKIHTEISAVCVCVNHQCKLFETE